jgi:hypothetical protein
MDPVTNATLAAANAPRRVKDVIVMMYAPLFTR